MIKEIGGRKGQAAHTLSVHFITLNRVLLLVLLKHFTTHTMTKRNDNQDDTTQDMHVVLADSIYVSTSCRRSR